MKLYNVLDVACFVINKHNELYPRKGITNLRLQKILYFIQCYFYLNYSRLCFLEEMEAWDFGPASREVYEEFCIYGGDNIKDTYSYFLIDKENSLVKRVNFDNSSICDKDKDLIEQVVKNCSSKSNYTLVEITRSQSPWSNNYEKGKKNKISNYDIEKFINNDIRQG